MAFAQVQTAAQVVHTGTTAVALTMSATGAGNLVVVHIRISDATTTPAVTDDKGNAYVVSAPVVNGSVSLFQAYGVQVTGGVTTVSVTPSASNTMRCGADEYSGGKTTNATVFDVTKTGTGTSTSLAVSTLTPAATGELIVGSYAVVGTPTWTNGTNYVLYSGGTTNTRSQYRLSSGASETAPVTISGGSVAWNAIASAFIPLGASSTKTLAALGVG